MKKATFLFTVAAAALLLAGSPVSNASGQALNVVTPGDTFSFDLVGFDFASGTGYFLTPLETATFGATTTFTGVGYNGQNITITSSETINGAMTTDTFTISTPTNFLTSPTINGTTINGLQFDLGDANSGGNMVSVVGQIGGYTATGTALYGTSSTATLTPTTMFGAGNTSYSAADGVNSGVATTPINGFAVRSINYSITYQTLIVPEPSTWAMLGFGVIAAGIVATRRRIKMA